MFNKVLKKIRREFDEKTLQTISPERRKASDTYPSYRFEHLHQASLDYAATRK